MARAAELEGGNRFRRQHPIGKYIVDFACPALGLVIELDGGQHAMQEAADAARTIDIAGRGYRVIRFWNSDVINNLPGVVEAIRQELETRGVEKPLSALQGGEGALSAERGGG